MAFALIMPPFQFNDEHGHFARAYQIARGEVVGHRSSRLPSAVLSSLRRYPEGLDPEGLARKSIPPTSAADLLTPGPGAVTGSEAIEDCRELRYFRWGNLAYQVYWPISYVPASIGIRIARAFGLSAVGMLYAARLTNVLFFAIALAVTLFAAPHFRALTTAIALMPMTLHQSAAVSGDLATIAFSLVGFALVLRTRERPVRRRYLLTVLVLVPFWVLCKNSLWALPLLLLIPASQFKGQGRRTVYVLSVALLAVTAVICWRSLSHDAFEEFRSAALSQRIDIYGNIRLVADHPVKVLGDIVTRHYSSNVDLMINRYDGVGTGRSIGAALNFANYVRRLANQFIGALSWNFIGPPLRFAYLTMLFAVAFVELNPKPFTIADRAILLFVFALALVEIYVLLIAIDGRYESGHFSFWSSGVTGRYIIPFCLAGSSHLSGVLSA
jgi:uncharacterized membrane protein